jgi:hypothetical protein
MGERCTVATSRGSRADKPPWRKLVAAENPAGNALANLFGPPLKWREKIHRHARQDGRAHNRDYQTANHDEVRILDRKT